MSEKLLTLFDLDGTLLVDDAYVHGRAMVRAMREVFGVSPPDDIVELIDPWGKTDPRIAREALHTAGLSGDAIDQYLGHWMAVAGDLFLEEAPSHADAWITRPDLAAGLRKLTESGMRLGLLTGNLREIAKAKLDLMGVASQFDLSVSAYGSDAEERNELVPIARERAGAAGRPWARERTVVVGDTPEDIAAARADSVACVVFASERFPDDRLIGAHGVVSDMDDLVRVLQSWQQAGGTPAPT